MRHIKKYLATSFACLTLGLGLLIPSQAFADCYPFTFVFNTPTETIAITMSENCSMVVTRVDR